jgi:hypothetical protein
MNASPEIPQIKSKPKQVPLGFGTPGHQPMIDQIQLAKEPFK